MPPNFLPFNGHQLLSMYSKQATRYNLYIEMSFEMLAAITIISPINNNHLRLTSIGTSLKINLIACSFFPQAIQSI